MGKKKHKSNQHHNHKPVAAVEQPTIDQPVATPAEVAAQPEPTPQVALVDTEPIKAAVEPTPTPTANTAAPVAGAAVKKRSSKYTIITIVLVVIALLVVVYQLERQDRIGTNIFGGMIASMEANAPVAVVNGTELNAGDLEAGVEQLQQAAAAQGLDPADPTVQAEIRTQAVDMLVNTTLLEQAAVAEGVIIEESAVEARISELAESAGGREALDARLAEFAIDEAQLYSDVRNELTIRALLDIVFADAEVTASEEEILAVYQGAVEANGPGVVPPLEEVRAQIEGQLVQTKEQEALDGYLQQLRADADIELN